VYEFGSRLTHAMAGDGYDAGRQGFGTEGGTEGRVDVALLKQVRNVRPVNEEVHPVTWVTVHSDPAQDTSHGRGAG
jgi:hypothetical protein